MEQDYDRSFAFFFSPAVIICWLAITIFLIAAQWKIYTKAGQPGWACIIPIYNVYVMLKIVGKPWWWLLLMLIPFVNLIYAIWMTNMLSKVSGRMKDLQLDFFSYHLFSIRYLVLEVQNI
jgi:hypothetical protein